MEHTCKTCGARFESDRPRARRCPGCIARWKANRELSPAAVIEQLPESARESAYIVGAWVWIRFAQKPDEPVLAAIRDLGFKWNKDRKCWQHPCGTFCRYAPETDPEAKYGAVPIQ